MKPLIDLKPLHKLMVVRKEFTDKVGSLFVARKKEERPICGMILSVGNEVTTPELIPGQRIVFKYAAGTTFDYKGELLALIHENDVDVIVDKDVKVTRTSGLYS